MEYFATTIQLIHDFYEENSSEVFADQRGYFLYLEIDALNRMAELGKHVGDIKSAIVDFEKVIELCKKFPTNNESTLNASLFALGKVHLDA